MADRSFLQSVGDVGLWGRDQVGRGVWGAGGLSRGELSGGISGSGIMQMEKSGEETTEEGGCKGLSGEAFMGKRCMG